MDRLSQCLARWYWLQCCIIVLMLACILGWGYAATRAQSYELTFGVGHAIAFADPDGRNQVGFWVTQPEATVDFTLYSLSPAGLIERYQAQQPWGDSTIDVTGLPVVSTWQQSFSGGDTYAVRPVNLPAGVASGLFVIEAHSPGLGQERALLVVGRTVLLLKQGNNGQITAWASALQSGAPVGGMTVTAYDAQANVLASAVTDADGVAMLDPIVGDPVMVIGQSSSETTIAGLDWQWRAFDGDGYWSPTTVQAHTIFLQTERPLYRPGDAIYYNAIVRNNATVGYLPVSSSEPVTITLHDSRNNLVATQVKTVDEFGALAGQFILADEPSLGPYQLALILGDQIQTQMLYVEEYRKPEYEVKVTTSAAYAFAGDALPISVAAGYFFGQPVANAVVTLKVYREAYYGDNPWWLSDQSSPAPTGLVAEISGVTDGVGNWSTIFTPDASTQSDASYRFEATVTDARQLPVTGEQSVVVFWNTFRLNISTGRYGYRSNEPVNAEVTARTQDDAPLAGQSLTVRVVRDEWPANTEVDVIPPQNVTTASNGEVTVALGVLPQGWYRLVASGMDARNRSIRSERYLWIYDENINDWWFPSDQQLSINADKSSYAAGETATLLIQSRVQGVALLTLERAGVHQERVVHLDGPVTAVDVPITAEFAPNLYAKIHLFSREVSASDGAIPEGRLLSAQTELIVPASDKRLTIEIAPDRATYAPSQTTTLTLRVIDALGQPVRGRISLAVVDEALFALQPDLTANLFETFYARQPNLVSTYHSLAGERYHFYWAEMPDQDGGAPAPTSTPGANTSTQGAPRRLFLDTAYWHPALVTGEDGIATVTFPMPDNLTTWRIVARVVTVDTRVGEAQQKVLVTQPIIARPALPRFAILGDRFATGVVAQNFSNGPAQGHAGFATAGMVILDPGARPISMPNNGVASAAWTAVAAEAGIGLVTSTVSTDAGQDIVELPLPIQPFAAPDRWVASGAVDPVVTEVFTLSFNAVNEASHLSVHLAPSIALGLLDGLDSLIDYPYGCVEQTMSRLLPAAVVAKAYADLDIPNPKRDEMPALISQGVQRLYGFQQANGSWGWFYDDDGGVYLTSYVLFGLIAVQQAGFAVDVAVLDRGFAYLDNTLDSVQEPGSKAFALYVKASAGRANLSLAQALIAQADQMDAAGLAALALALHLSGDDSNAQAILDRLLAQAEETPGWAFWPLADDQWDWFHWQSMSSSEKNTAFALRALLALRPHHALTPKVVRWMMDHRNGAGWGGYGSANTQATAFAVLGLADYIHLAGELAPDYSYTVALNGATLASGQVTPATARQPLPPLVIAGNGLRMGANELRIERTASSSGQLYYSARLDQQLFFDGFAPVSSVDQGLALRRTYRLVEGQPRNDGAYNLGDLVEVQLMLTARERTSYLLIEDPLPAGFEALNERVNPQMWGDCIWCATTDAIFWQEWGYNRKEVRADRVDFFITDLAAGEHTFTYLMRAVAAGEFSVLPGQAYPMYHEEMWGRSASERISVAPETLANRPTLAGDFDRSCSVSQFDLRQLAPFYGASVADRNLLDDDKITLRDLLAVAHRTGARCGDDKPLPGGSPDATHILVTTGASQIQIGEPFSVDLTLSSLSNGAGQLGAVGLTLNYDITTIEFVAVDWNRALGMITPLGPTVDRAAGQVTLGVVQLPAGWPATQPLATLTFIGRGVGEGGLTIDNIEAADGANQTLQASGEAAVKVAVAGERVLLPVVWQ
jgi:uncharacterized protein YfaS (alpha-2-macroglobulin family)